MTKQEQQRMTRLEIENNELREKISRHMEVYGDLLIEIIELKATISLIQSAINWEVPGAAVCARSPAATG